jgi:hypothetical protein
VEREWDRAIVVPDTQGQPQRCLRLCDTPAATQGQSGSAAAEAGAKTGPAIVATQGTPPLCRSGRTRASAQTAPPPPPHSGPWTRGRGTQRPGGRAQPRQQQ